MTGARDPDGPFSEPDPRGLPPAGAFHLEVERPLRSYLPVATNVTLLSTVEVSRSEADRNFKSEPTAALSAFPNYSLIPRIQLVTVVERRRRTCVIGWSHRPRLNQCAGHAPGLACWL